MQKPEQQSLRELLEDFKPLSSASRLKNAGDILEEGGKTFKERHAVYGNNFLKVGDIMVAMFPKGLTLTTSEDWIRLELLMMKIVKFSRYAENFVNGGHEDSIHDDMVYSAMLEFVDSVVRHRSVEIIKAPSSIASEALQAK